jgi:hypothetical protein
LTAPVVLLLIMAIGLEGDSLALTRQGFRSHFTSYRQHAALPLRPLRSMGAVETRNGPS